MRIKLEIHPESAVDIAKCADILGQLAMGSEVEITGGSFKPEVIIPKTAPVNEVRNKPKVKETPTPEQKPVVNEATGISEETVRANVNVKIEGGYKAGVVALLKKYGAKKMSEVKPEDYEAFNTEILALE